MTDASQASLRPSQCSTLMASGKARSTASEGQDSITLTTQHWLYDGRRETHISDENVSESLEFVNEYAEGGAANQGSAETARRERALSELALGFALIGV